MSENIFGNYENKIEFSKILDKQDLLHLNNADNILFRILWTDKIEKKQLYGKLESINRKEILGKEIEIRHIIEPIILEFRCFPKEYKIQDIMSGFIWFEYLKSDFNKSTNNIKSIIELLKCGDKIVFVFLVGNNNQLLNDAELHQDDCYINIFRIHKNEYKLKYSFLCDSKISKNNSARMIRFL